MITQLSLLPGDDRTRAGRDRLELLTALLAAPAVDPVYRAGVIELPPDHPVYGWACQVEGCQCAAQGWQLCVRHVGQWRDARKSGITRADFLKAAVPRPVARAGAGRCRICPDRPASSGLSSLCVTHHRRWLGVQSAGPAADFSQWAAAQAPLAGHGSCRVPACPLLASTRIGLCRPHAQRYQRAGKPTSATAAGQLAFRRWCSSQAPFYRAGTVNLLGLRPLVRAEIQWAMSAHAQARSPSRWDYGALQHLAILCQAGDVTSLFGLPRRGPGPLAPPGRNDSRVAMIAYEIAEGLRCVYYSPCDSRDAGFIETDHFGRRFSHARSHFDLTAVSQRWLRDMLWDHLAGVLRSPRCPRSRSPFDYCRRAVIELSAFLESDGPQGGHDPALLRQEHAQRFAADQRHRARHELPALGIFRSDGKPSTVTEDTRRVVFNQLHAMAYRALESGGSDSIGLHRDFITALPPGGNGLRRSRSPFSDVVARALADEGNLSQLAAVHDPYDRGVRDAWEAIVCTGRRCGEVLTLRLDCIGRYRGLAMLWHDQTKVGNYNEAVRIPDALYHRLDARRERTLARFGELHGRPPDAAERATMALFPSNVRNRRGDRPISYRKFNSAFKAWVGDLDLGPAVAHQARHTLATNLLRAGASLAHIRRYLGQVSDRMAEHYIKVAHSDLEDILLAVWVAGPGSAMPGELLSGGLAPMSREEALALALDLSRRSTPADGGFCTFQPVVDGGACPWNLDCHNCDKFVLSGADLLYWRRKQEQWRTIAERAPDDATADYLHQVFEPTARAIDGLEKALGGLGLLDQALAVDLRRPQDYFQRIWSTSFRAADLASAADGQASVRPGLAGGPA